MTVKDIVARLSDGQLEYEDDFSRIDIWNSWYEGFVKSFHEYKVYNGSTATYKKMHTLHMGKKICEDWADLLYNERCMISTDQEESTDRLNALLDDLAFETTINTGIELGMAHGTEGFVLSYRNDDRKLHLEKVEARKIFPISYDNDHISECAFISSMVKDGQDLAYVSVHQKNKQGKYVIENAIYKISQPSEDGRYTLDSEPEEYWVFDTQSEYPWFAIFRPNEINNFNPDSPYGISVFANAVNELECVDNAFDTIDNELTAGRMRILVATEALNYNPDGTETPVFDPKDTVFQKLPKGINEESIITTVAPQLRTESQIAALNNALRHLSAKVGMGSNHYSYDSETGGLKTATEVISDNAPLYRRIKKHEKTLEGMLKSLINAIAEASTNFLGVSVRFDQVNIQFDDSIIQDKDTERKQDIQDINLGVMSKVEYRMKWYGETEDEAAKAVEEAQKYDTNATEEGDF